MSDDKKSNYMGLKSLLAIGLITGSVYVGDKFQPIKAISDNSFYRNSSVEDGYYQNPKNLDIAMQRNDKNRIEVYLVDKITNDTLPINENMTAGSVGGSIDNFIDEKKSGLKDWWQEQKQDTTSLIYKIGEKF